MVKKIKSAVFQEDEFTRFEFLHFLKALESTFQTQYLSTLDNFLSIFPIFEHREGPTTVLEHCTVPLIFGRCAHKHCRSLFVEAHQQLQVVNAYIVQHQAKMPFLPFEV